MRRGNRACSACKRPLGEGARRDVVNGCPISAAQHVPLSLHDARPCNVRVNRLQQVFLPTSRYRGQPSSDKNSAPVGLVCNVGGCPLQSGVRAALFAHAAVWAQPSAARELAGRRGSRASSRAHPQRTALEDAQRMGHVALQKLQTQKIM